MDASPVASLSAGCSNATLWLPSAQQREHVLNNPVTCFKSAVECDWNLATGYASDITVSASQNIFSMALPGIVADAHSSRASIQETNDALLSAIGWCLVPAQSFNTRSCSIPVERRGWLATKNRSVSTALPGLGLDLDM